MSWRFTSMRKLNLIFLAILATAVALTGWGLYVVHGIQMRRNASALLERARAAEAQNDSVKAEESLGWYLNLRRDDGPVWAWYARVVDQQDTERRRTERVFLVHQEALRHNPDDRLLERQCAKLAVEVGRHGDARRLLTHLLDGIPQEPEDRAEAAERAELEELLGQCDRAMARYEDAESWLVLAIQHDPGRIDCYDQLARLRRVDLRRNEAADETIREMIAKNNGSGRAYNYRWRYARAYAPPADPGDISRALKLAPEDPEVLFTAAVASEEQQDVASARAYFEKGFEIAPKNSAFALGLASLEIRENHLEQAEATLRRGYQANPSLGMAFELAEILILQSKIDGNDQATDTITRLRKAGLSDTYLGYLEARILFQQKKWAEAIPRLEMAKTVLRSDPRLMPRLELMLAECYGRMGLDERRLDALRNACEGDGGPEPARIELAQALARSGKLEQAIGILLPLIERKPEIRLEHVRILIRKASREPGRLGTWEQVEGQLRQAEKALPRSVEPLTLIRGEVLTAQNRLDDSRSLLNAALAKETRVLSYRLALARLAQRQGRGAEALQILDQAEKDLGPGLAIQLARLSYWDSDRGDAAKAAVATLAETGRKLPAADRPIFLDALARIEGHLGELAPARVHCRELAALQPGNVQILLDLFDLAMKAADHDDALEIVAKVRAIEGDRGTLWRFGQASYLLDQARRGVTKDLGAAKELAAEIVAQRPNWWGSSVLLAEVAELEGQSDETIQYFTRAIELGNTQPALARRLVGLLNQRKDFDQIERVIKILSDRGLASGDLIVSTALQAIRQQDYARGIALARHAFPEKSTNYADHLYMGQFYLAARQPEEAGKAFRRAVELGPGVPITWVSYVQYLVLEKQVDQARTTVEAARKALPPERANLALAQCSAMIGDLVQAETMIQAALQSPTCDLTTIRVATDLYINQGRFDQVEPILDKLRDSAMGTTPAVLAWANRTRSLARLSTGRSDEMNRAMALVEENLRANPSSPDDLRLKAILLALRTSRRADAIKLLEPLERSNQLGSSEQFVLAQTYLAEGLVDKYRDQMVKILGAGVKNLRHLAHFIDFLIERQELDQADQWMAEWKSMAPQSLGLFEREARLLDLRGRRPELLDLLQSRDRQAPDEIGAVAGLLDRLGFVREAEAAYKSFIARIPSEPERVLTLASFLARQDRTKEAIAILDNAWKTCRPEAVAGAALALLVAPSADENLRRQVEAWVSAAIQKSPTSAAPLRPKLATIYCRQERYDEAEALFRQILRSDPDNVETLNNLAWELALREPSKPQEALDLIDRAIEKAGRTSTLVDTRAVALIRVGEPDRALRDLRDALAADPKNVSLALHLAWAYQAAGEAEEARKAFQHAGALGLRPEARDPLEREFIERLRSQLSTNEPSSSTRG
jgi:tetratricopeptide (TPR) repeat protein